MLGDDVERALAGFGEVAQGIFGFVEAAGVADDEDWRVVVDDLEVGEGGEIGGLA